jgi:hypothetical protein
VVGLQHLQGWETQGAACVRVARIVLKKPEPVHEPSEERARVYGGSRLAAHTRAVFNSPGAHVRLAAHQLDVLVVF